MSSAVAILMHAAGSLAAKNSRWAISCVRMQLIGRANASGTVSAMTQASTPEHGALRVPRRATAHRGDGGPETKSLADWRALDAYVLLGDPGAGKSWSFQAESAACNGLLIPARDIVDKVAPATIDNRIVFIDGLDEVRAGVSNGKALFGAIREWLHNVGRPRFRLSCREADWLGESDQSALARVAPTQQVEVLHLEPLQHDEVMVILRDRTVEVPNPDAFLQQAEQFGLTALFGNPLLLDLTIKAVTASGGNWPSTRQGIYEAACRQLAMESSVEHRAVNPPQPGDIDHRLSDAGLLCAVLLLSGKQSWSLQAGGMSDTVGLSELPADLQLHNARAALASKVFTTVAGQSTPRHRSIAEFLAAKALAKRLNDGLPIGRLLALMQGFDGKPVEPMRGLLAWLAVHHARDRSQLIRLDPLGIVLNGDVAALGTSERLELLQALSEAARQDRNFRRNAWVSHPFGPLATTDMESTYDALLRDPQRSDEHQAFIDCVLDALCHGDRMAGLRPALETWVTDASAWAGNRVAAYQAWKHSADSKLHPAQQKEWLESVSSGAIADSDDRLTGSLLTDMYPEQLGPREVLKFLRAPSRRNLTAEYSMFWRQALIKQSRPQDFAELADSWAEVRPSRDDEAQDYDARKLSGQILAAALSHSGDEVSTERLYAWLGIGVNEYGFSKLVDDSKREVARWLEERPGLVKAVVALGFQLVQSDENGHRAFWEAEQRLHGARKPRDWLHWLLELAASTNDEELAKDCFLQVAYLVVASPTAFDVPSMDEVERWVDAHSVKWPMARVWLQDAWTSKIEDSRGESYRRQLKYKAQQFQGREQRKRSLETLFGNLAKGEAPVRFLHQLALAHDDRFTDIYGDTPLERIQDFLVSDAGTAQAALDGLDKVLAREDLPTAEEIFSAEAKGKQHLVLPAALLAASRSFERAPDAPQDWPDELAQKLVAFYLADGIGNMPDWYKHLAAHRPELVAPILIRYAAPKLKHKGNAPITGLWALSQESGQQALTRLVLPALLEKFPLRASEPNRRELNRSLLAALPLLDDAQAASIGRAKLAQPGMDPAQRICWLVAELPYRAEAADDLAQWIGKNERRAVALGAALYEQGSLGRTVHRLSPDAVRRLIEVLAPITPRDMGSHSGTVTVANERERTVSRLFEALSSNPSTTARDQLHALSESSQLGKWKDVVDYSVRAQQSVAREALFQAADPASVAQVIANLAPANAADLLALVVWHLRDIEAHLRGADTHLVRQFWQTKAEGGTPHDENFCRDILLNMLRDRLKPLNVRLEREASAAADKRADVRAEFMRAGQRIAAPIEVKKENHKDLWTAWRNQLQRLYTNDPAATGYGLYLVLWFGHSPKPTPGGISDGVKPIDARDMQRLLVERVPEVDRSRLAVMVLDLSLPISG
jgi:hypothetical protein